MMTASILSFANSSSCVRYLVAVFSPPYKAGVPSEVQEAKTIIIYKLASKNKGPEYIPAGCE